jgi:hypothetical protein
MQCVMDHDSFTEIDGNNISPSILRNTELRLCNRGILTLYPVSKTGNLLK